MADGGRSAPTREMVQVERTDGLARVTLDRPPLNVLDIAGMEALARALTDLSGDPGVKAVVLTGRGRAFCAGVDVADHTEDRVGRMLEAFHDVLEAMLTMEVPLVAAVNGAALGGGCELGREGARVGQPEILLGVFPPAAAVLLPRLVGRQIALDLLLSGRTVRMEEARALGLASRVFPEETFREEVEAYAQGLASLSRPVLRLTKRAVRDAEGRPPLEALERAHALYRDELMALHDPHEGLAAFLEKRTPAWRDA